MSLDVSLDVPLDGREIVLAGGSGGLGSGAAEWLARDRARLFVSYCHNEDRAEKLKRDLSSIPDSKIGIIRADITKPADRAHLLNSAPKLYGLVLLAGIR
jgi:NAD(P)-dependent dehydrogenase (short-subunit alcohol dehydrogenase family)